MNVSEHLLVLVSIIIGLAITELLTGVRQLVRARKRIRLHWLPLAWAGFVVLALVQAWWAQLAQAERWGSNFFVFVFILLNPVVVYLAASSLLPDPTEMDETTDLLDYYFEGRVWVFGLFAFSYVLTSLGDVILDRQRPNAVHAFRLVGVLLLVSLAWSRSVRYHAVASVVGLALFVSFVLQFALSLTR